jgi:pimeloyl-ACP methyl ester carboxylesterase
VKKVLAGAVAAGLVIGALATLAPTAANVLPTLALASETSRNAGGAASTVTQGESSVTWATCDGPLGAEGVECATLAVPLDHNQPNGQKIGLALSRVKHTVPEAKYQGVMLVNPGGPGGSGLAMATQGRRVPSRAGDAYDWIGFDPRGVGASRPALTCDPNYAKGPRPKYDPSDGAIERTWLDRAAGYASACGNAGGVLTQNMKTIDVAKDVDLIRIALGQKQINYYGFSYGTYIGQVYSTLYPKNVRRMVFDGTVDPRKVWYRANLDQDIAFEKTMWVWFAWLARYDGIYHLGNTAREVQLRFNAEQGKLDKSPAGGVVGSSEWIDTFLQAGYFQGTWTNLGDVFSRWANGRDATRLVGTYERTASVGNDNGYAVYTAVQCTDTQWPQQWQTWKDDNSRTARMAPFYTWANAWFNAPCLTWPAGAGELVNINGGDVPNVLMINETLDAATPYPGSLEVRRRYPGARLIAEPGGTTHSGSLSGNACVDDRIAAYLATGALPGRVPGDSADVICPPLLQPVPGAAARTRGAPGRTADLATRARRSALQH